MDDQPAREAIFFFIQLREGDGTAPEEKDQGCEAAVAVGPAVDGAAVWDPQ
jgi:hypothetical protein